jgi:hypothetical protein
MLEKAGDSAYRLSLPPYMHIYLIVNVENIKNYGNYMLEQEIDENVLPTIQDLELKD